MNSFLRSVCLLCCLILGSAQSTLCAPSAHEEQKSEQPKQAVVLAAFGTTVPGALPGILNIRERIAKKYPNTPVYIAFTSNIVRGIWHKRRDDKQFLRMNPDIPREIMNVRGPLATIADLQDEGYRTIIVQPSHISLGEEYLDLVSYIEGLNAIATIKPRFRPFDKLAIGRPAMGTVGEEHPYTEDLQLIARALAADAAAAEQQGAALLYMAHGNTSMPSGSAYLEFAAIMNRLYPRVKTYIALVEGFPSLDLTLPQIEKDGARKLLLKPFMTVAGDHTLNDMAGDEPDSWKSLLTKKGFSVVPVRQGLGEVDTFADVFVSHLGDTARDQGIVLR